jgi:hypothetical protein
MAEMGPQALEIQPGDRFTKRRIKEAPDGQ